MVWSLVFIHFDSPQLGYYKNKLYKTSDHWFRDMLTLNFPEKGQGLVFPIRSVYDFSRKMFLMLYSINDQISLSYCLYFSRYWTICVLQLSVNQPVTSKNSKFTLPSSRFATRPKIQDKNVNIFRTKKASEVK